MCALSLSPAKAAQVLRPIAAVISARYLPGKPGSITDEAIDLDGFDDELAYRVGTVGA